MHRLPPVKRVPGSKSTFARVRIRGASSLYVFVNRRGNQLKCLYFDRSGFCLWGKRLEHGRFIGDWSRVRTQEMDWTALKLLIEGMEARQVRRRYALPKAMKAL